MSTSGRTRRAMLIPSLALPAVNVTAPDSGEDRRNEIARVRIILDHDDPDPVQTLAGGRARSLVFGVGSVSHRHGGDRQDDGERRPLPCPGALGAHRPPWSSTRWRTIASPRPRPACARVLVPSDCLNRSKICGRSSVSMPRPVSLTINRASISRTSWTCGAVLRRELDRVAEDVLDDLAQPVGVAMHRAGVGIEVGLQGHRLGVGGRAHRLHDAGDQRRKVHGLRAEVEPTEDDATGVEQIADQPGLLVDVALDHLERPCRRAGVEMTGAEHPDPAERRVQRGAQLVGQHRQKIVLRPIGGFRFLARGVRQLGPTPRRSRIVERPAQILHLGDARLRGR